MIRLTMRLLPLMTMMGFDPAPASAAAAPDTVIGVAFPQYRGETAAWTPERFVRIRNRHGAAIKVLPPAHEPVYREVTGNQGSYPYPWAYSVRKFVDGLPRVNENIWVGDTLSLAAGDSLDFGIFQIGPQAIPKRSAAAPPLQGQVGDTVRVPVTIRYGSDSLRFILKTKIAETVIGGPNPILALIGDRDTVLGITPPTWKEGQEWKRENYIRVWNRHAHTLVIDSIRFPADSLVGSGSFAQPMDRLFAVRTYAGGIKVTPAWTGRLKDHPVTLAIGDSADFGLFEIGRILFLVKQSAAAGRYRLGDTLIAPVTLFAGNDSLRFILKTKVVEGFAGTAIAPRLPQGAYGREAGALSVSADGRADLDGAYAKRIFFSVPGPGTASRRR